MTTNDEVITCLQNGGVALLPTDTVYGLAASPAHESAVQKIFDLKQRPRTVNLPIMVASREQLEWLGLDINPYAAKLLASSLMPGAVSLVLGFVSGPTVPWLHGREEVAIRIPNDENLLHILRATGPLLVTSANKHGRPDTPLQTPEILAELNGAPDIVVDDGERRDKPSTIINCRLNPPVVERYGGIEPEVIFKIFNHA
jgi:L-threonylcarbamoyladenylate synthase